MRYLGIDYGMKKIGLSVSEGQIASPLDVITVSSLTDAIEKVKQAVKKHEINRIVIGVPESKTGEMVKKFVIALKKEYISEPVEVIETEETLTSHDARQLMISLGTSKKDRKKEDAYSAALILQQFLDTLS